mgnify:CR=1 FL=1
MRQLHGKRVLLVEDNVLNQEVACELLREVGLVVDLAAVTELDTCGLQLLMLAKRTAAKVGSQLQLVSHSPAVLEVFELLNVAAFFGDHLVIPPSNVDARKA